MHVALNNQGYLFLIQKIGECYLAEIADEQANKRWEMINPGIDFDEPTLISPNGNIIAQPYKDNTIKIWSDSISYPLTYFYSSGAPFPQFSPNGQYFILFTKQIVNHEGNDIIIYRLNIIAATGEIISNDPCHTSGVKLAVFSHNSRYILTIGMDGLASVWDIDQKKRSDSPREEGFAYSSRATFSANNKRIIMYYENKTIRIYDLEWKLLKEWGAKKPKVKQCIFSPNGKLIAYVVKKKNRYFVEVCNDKGEEIYPHPKDGQNEEIETLCFSPDCKYVLAASNYSTARLWDMSGNSKNIKGLNYNTVDSIGFSPDNQAFFIRSENKVYIYNISCKLINELMIRANLQVSFSADSRHIIICPGTGASELFEKIDIFDFQGNEISLEDASNIETIAGHPLNKKIIITSSFGKESRGISSFWNSFGENLLYTAFKKTNNAIIFADLSNDGNFLLVNYYNPANIHIDAGYHNITEIWPLNVDFLKSDINLKNLSHLSGEIIERAQIEKIHYWKGVVMDEQVLAEGIAQKIYECARYYRILAERSPSNRKLLKEKAKGLMEELAKNNPIKPYITELQLIKEL